MSTTKAAYYSSINDKRFFLFSECPDLLSGLPSHLFNGPRVPSPGVKQVGQNVDHSLPSSFKV